MKAVVIGPGRGGCGFVGPALRERGFDVVFVGRDPQIVESLNRLGRYHVELVQGGLHRELTVDGVRAVRSSDRDLVTDEIAGADLLATAVGAHQLREIAPLIADGLRRRTAPLNVVCFENLADAGERLRTHVAEHLTDETDLARHGFAGALIARAVTGMRGDPGEGGPVTFVGDMAEGFAVERRRLTTPLPDLPGMTLVDDYTAAVQAKLYIFSAGHAVAAYLGHLKGHRFIHTALRDPHIRASALGAMAEGRCGIAARHGPAYAGPAGVLRTILERFENAALRDPVSRVGRDPLRKLASDDRLIGAARLARDAGIVPVNLCTAAAAALAFTAASDASAGRLRAQLQRDGVTRTLACVTGLAEDDPLVHRIAAAYRAHERPWPTGGCPAGVGRLNAHVRAGASSRSVA